MWRYHVRKAVKKAKVSRFEEHAFLAAPVLVVAGIVVAIALGDVGGIAAVLGWAGLTALLVCAASRGIRLYLGGMTASLPTPVRRVPRTFSAITAVLALGMPLATAVAVLLVLTWGWMLLAALLLFAGGAMFLRWLKTARRGEEPYAGSSAAAAERLRRLCMRADMRDPGLVVAPGRMATAWTAGGQIHVTKPLLDLLDDAELDAVLAHELAHLAQRDAAVMEISSAPSRVLLTLASSLPRGFKRWMNEGGLIIPGGNSIASLLLLGVVFCAPPAFVIGWISRLSVLGISRSREFAADAAAAALTGRPSALASALLKLEHQRGWTPRRDLRQVEPIAVLCIVGSGTSRLGRLFATHPPTAARVKRLEQLERRGLRERPARAGRRA